VKNFATFSKKKIKNGQILHYQNSFSKISQFLGQKTTKLSKLKIMAIHMYPKVLCSPHLSTLPLSELTIISDNGGLNLKVKAPW
jgi:hypothetical protein